VFGIAVGTHILQFAVYCTLFIVLLKDTFSDCSLHMLCCESPQVVEWG